MKKEEKNMQILISTAQVRELLGGISTVKFEKVKKDPTFPKPESKFSSKRFFYYSRSKVENWINSKLD